jgi:hypothetical protein
MDNITLINKKLVSNNRPDFLNSRTDASLEVIPISVNTYPAYASFPWFDFTYFFNINFYAQVEKSFSANVFGMGGPLNGKASGNIHTKHIQRLLTETVSYNFNGTENDFNLNFFDENSNLLGNFSCDSFLLFGVGGGVGSWS